ncbi:zinc finger C4H2 domain-containing protein isoform X1 [Danaus plexippus]|uniref:Hepatocellular carcinoma-associated antigen 127 protein n=1 Tax=Danaus plexippus plexippus TaxID=278856 RepID=A0A212FHT0_DANPL|nr:zinc finger C4H2 domain-containing protein isoform X1 [Danaus plexippus]XP_061378545.1 zinc finger C4H2 domain-containing protein isoform X1 [Danaus plexippus]XP_061378546.1 zinc finger C4H2 domain-containing protein isoform X1 [Danaus plexippus]OWR53295.1 Hepatocellular carcinoma-associated antigen 127 protein [Danaus plexippus plexippus]
MTAENEREIYHKLEAMKEIRNKTITLERLKRSILNEVRSGDQEGRCLAQYKREMELLQQEKMSHVEELRQIHADINAMETVIKQTEESMSRKLTSAARLHEDYRPLKHEVDLLRRQCLGLDRLPELHEEEGSPVTPDRFPAGLSGSRSLSVGAAVGAVGAVGAAGAGSFLAPAPRKPPPPPPAFRSALDQDFLTVSLRQQPPPMKSCLSCHQQIHRNAPICPLCKAKSRSRNPKKPKKK